MRQSSTSHTAVDKLENARVFLGKVRTFVTLSTAPCLHEVRAQVNHEVVQVITTLLVVGLTFPLVSPPHLFL